MAAVVFINRPMSLVNRQIVLASRPSGEVSPNNFRLIEAPLAPLAEGQVRVRHHYLSKSYAASQAIDEVMIGGTVGEVVESKNAHFAVGEKVVGMGGWQEFQTVDATQRGVLQKVDTTHIPLAAPQLILVNRMKVEGFIVFEHMDVWPEALKELGGGVATGQLKFRESIAQGLENAPEAFIGLLKGRNFGKQLVKLL